MVNLASAKTEDMWLNYFWTHLGVHETRFEPCAPGFLNSTCCRRGILPRIDQSSSHYRGNQKAMGAALEPKLNPQATEKRPAASHVLTLPPGSKVIKACQRLWSLGSYDPRNLSGALCSFLYYSPSPW